jgi:hypothetical protein
MTILVSRAGGVMLLDDEMFPVLWQGSRQYKEDLERLGCPRFVPWEFMVPLTAAAQRLHDQTLERLAERGGLSPEEILALELPATAPTADKLAAWRAPPSETVPKLLARLHAFQHGAVAIDGPAQVRLLPSVDQKKPDTQ